MVGVAALLSCYVDVCVVLGQCILEARGLMHALPVERSKQTQQHLDVEV